MRASMKLSRTWRRPGQALALAGVGPSWVAQRNHTGICFPRNNACTGVSLDALSPYSCIVHSTSCLQSPLLRISSDSRARPHASLN